MPDDTLRAIGVRDARAAGAGSARDITGEAISVDGHVENL